MQKYMVFHVHRIIGDDLPMQGTYQLILQAANRIVKSQKLFLQKADNYVVLEQKLISPVLSSSSQLSNQALLKLQITENLTSKLFKGQTIVFFSQSFKIDRLTLFLKGEKRLLIDFSIEIEQKSEKNHFKSLSNISQKIQEYPQETPFTLQPPNQQNLTIQNQSQNSKDNSISSFKSRSSNHLIIQSKSILNQCLIQRSSNLNLVNTESNFQSVVELINKQQNKSMSQTFNLPKLKGSIYRKIKTKSSDPQKEQSTDRERSISSIHQSSHPKLHAFQKRLNSQSRLNMTTLNTERTSILKDNKKILQVLSMSFCPKPQQKHLFNVFLKSEDLKPKDEFQDSIEKQGFCNILNLKAKTKFTEYRKQLQKQQKISKLLFKDIKEMTLELSEKNNQIERLKVKLEFFQTEISQIQNNFQLFLKEKDNEIIKLKNVQNQCELYVRQNNKLKLDLKNKCEEIKFIRFQLFQLVEDETKKQQKSKLPTKTKIEETPKNNHSSVNILRLGFNKIQK